jgi:hypothetical protein
LGPSFGAIAGGAAVAIGATAAIGAALGKIGGDVERLSQQANQLGVSFNFMQTLAVASQYAGGNVESLNAAFTKFQRAVVDARGGSESASKAFQQLGISQAELSSSSPEDVFNKTAEALARVQDPAERSALAVKLFGKSGNDIVKLAGDIGQARTDMVGLGLAFSTIDTDRFNDLDKSFDRLGVATGALGRTLLIPFTELFSYVGNGLADFIGGLTAALNPIAQLIAPIGGAVGLVAEVILRSLGLIGRAIGAGLAPLTAFAGLLTKLIAQLRSGFQQVAGYIQSVYDNLERFLSTIPFIGAAFKDSNKEVSGGGEALAKQLEDADKLAEAAKKVGDKWRDEITKATQTPLDAFRLKLEDIAKSDLNPADAVKATDLAVKQYVQELDIKIVADTSPVEKYNTQLAALNAITANSAEQERLLGQARVQATKDFLKSLPDAAKVQSPFDKLQSQLSELDKAQSGLSPVDDAATIAEIEAKKVRLREEFAQKELASEESRRAGLERQLKELDAIQKEFANDQTALQGVKEKREKIEKEIADIGKTALAEIQKDRDRVNKLLGRAGGDAELTQDIEAISKERARAQKAFDEAITKGNAAAADQAQAKLADLKAAEDIAKQNAKQRELDAAGISGIVKPATDALEKQFATLQKFRDNGKITGDEFNTGLQNLFAEGAKIQQSIAQELSKVDKQPLKVSDIRSSEGIAEYLRLANGREDPAVQQRREQLDKLTKIEELLRQAGMVPAEILG